MVILERDGVISHRQEEDIITVEGWDPISGSIEAISRLKKAGYLVTIASNHSGISRGYYSEGDLKNMCSAAPAHPCCIADLDRAATLKGCVPGTVRIKKLAANLERSPLTRSIGYGLAGDRSTLFVRGVPKQRIPAPHPFGSRAQNRSRRFCARFPLIFVPFMQYAG